MPSLVQNKALSNYREKSNGGKNFQKTITKFLISTLEYIHVPSFL